MVPGPFWLGIWTLWKQGPAFAWLRKTFLFGGYPWQESGIPGPQKYVKQEKSLKGQHLTYSWGPSMKQRTKVQQNGTTASQFSTVRHGKQPPSKLFVPPIKSICGSGAIAHPRGHLASAAGAETAGPGKCSSVTGSTSPEGPGTSLLRN